MSNRFGAEPIPGIDAHGSPVLMPENSQLRVLNGPEAGRVFNLRRTLSIVGRHDPPRVKVDIDLTECELGSPAMVSRRHAELQWVENKLQIVDLCSRNGTFVNGNRLVTPPEQPSTPHPIRFGDKIRFANLETEVTAVEI